MNLIPVIQRELRAESRHPATYWFRPIGALVLLLASVFLWLEEGRGQRFGRELFTALHQFLFLTIWLLVPLMTADCVSREKREQTLGLLFLTPLRAWEIMFAKALVHGLRGATVCIAVVPILVLPLLIGGVGWSTVTISLLTNASAFLWALAAGLLASVLSRSILGGLIWALVLAAVFLVIHSILNGLAMLEIIGSISGRGRVLPSSEWLIGIGLLGMWKGEQMLEMMLLALPPSAQQLWLSAGIVILVTSLGGLFCVWQIGAWRLKQSWQELPPSKEREKMQRQLCQPRFAVGLLRSSMRRLVDRNPIGWLERRRWTSRAALWAWLGLLSVGYTLALGSFSHGSDIDDTNSMLALALIGALALTSAASFQRERETGVMELLLTTPLSPEQLVSGRLRGIWAQFLPSVIVLASVTVFIERVLNYSAWNNHTIEAFIKLWLIAVCVLTVPVTGLWLSLRMRHYMASLVLLIGAAIALPFAIATVITIAHSIIGWDRPIGREFMLGSILASLSLGICGGWQLRRTIGRTGFLIATVVLLSIGGTAIIEGGYWPAWDAPSVTRSTMSDHRWRIPLLLPSLQLAVAGYAHRRLLKSLHQRTFAFKV